MTRLYKFDSDTRKNEHVLIVEKALGRALKRVECVHHVDNDARNNEPGNLVLCPDQAYHMLLHKRQEALDTCGNANYRKCYLCKKWDDPSNMFVRCKNKNSTSPSYEHRACNRAYQKALTARKNA